MGRRIKKKNRPLQKENKVSTHSPKVSPPKPSPNVDAVDGGVTVPVLKAQKQCLHLDKGVNLSILNEKLGSSETLKCEDCRDCVADRRGAKGKGKAGKKKGSADSKSESKAIWVCLECGHFACGGVGLPTTNQSHAVRHSRLARHPLVIQLENPHLRWCFPCSTLISVETTDENGEKKDPLLEVVKLIKKRSKKSVDVEEVWFGSGSIASEIKAEGAKLSSTEQRSLYAPRGLVNLGNTCFFNSVMQNLLAMDKLRDFFFTQEASFGPLTISLKKLFTETKQETGLKNVIDPRSFFGSICSKAPQFKGYQQQDSHELLRCLLDGLSSEELAVRKQVNAANENGISLKHDPTYVEALFGGQISNTVSCIECGHSSNVSEPFLDLSLPVPTKKPPTKKGQPISRSKKTKLPPKRAGRIRAKTYKSADPVPAESTSNLSASSQLPCQNQSAENTVASSGDAVGAESIGLTAVAENSGVASQKFSAVPDTQNEQIAENTVEQTVVSFDDFSWMDYLEQESDEQNFTLQNKDVSTSQYSENVNPNDGLMESNQVCPVDEGPNLKLDSSVNPSEEEAPVQVKSSEVLLLPYKEESFTEVNSWEEEVPVQVKSSEVLLLPYKEESFTEVDMMKEGAEASSVGCGQDQADFDGFGDLFNEPEVSSGPVAGPSLVNGTSGNGFTAVSISESDPDEVDNSNSPVSVESCLAHFIKPEILSNDNAWECDNCSEILRRQRLESKKKAKTAVVTTNNGSETQIQSPPPSLNKENLCSTEVGDLHNRDIRMGSFISDSDASLVDVKLNEKDDRSNQNCMKTEGGQTDALNQTISKCEKQKGSALDEPSHSYTTFKSCGQESFSCPEVGSSSSDGPSSNRYATAKDQMGELHFSGNCGAEENEDEEGTSKKLKVKRDATKRVLIDKAPPVLTIHLKRFSQDARGRLSKLNGHVNFNEVLDLRPYIDQRCPNRQECVYRLLGVVEHLGTMRGGHYVAYVRSDKRSKDKADSEIGSSVWYHASDANVREVSLEDVLRCEAYILFYEKI
ncbi:ubiquitin carboxyl-terminal hydrolase 2-like [Mercurialis annua]|uniref:ubiquitin carboxyl-terminal hydrolase 2-like n=1 Tax=Mercurialis annua TaxID=3986 RepID=UPI00215F5D91|nr:ubiquitin carboxyl-terminal hydrolase 2-like [Mercurialis annua]XP_050219641.1 ubiquitin carboxyl-terminal hydrolase 2-like [Mercurialis annua]